MSAMKAINSGTLVGTTLGRALRLLGGISLGLLLGLAGCDQSALEEAPIEDAVSPVSAFNGMGWNGLSFNGMGWNGIGWNGMGWNGLGFNGMGWNGWGWNGMGWNGMGWNGMGWNGMGWNGMGWNGVPGQDAPTFSTLHNWLNHTDVDGNGKPTAQQTNQCGPPGVYDPAYLNDSTDLQSRLEALSYWVSCACPAGMQIPFGDTHGRTNVTLRGGLGLAPTWCGADVNAQVPESEMQMVSACLLARVNLRGEHVPLSLRGYDASLALTANESFSQNFALSSYAGNLWKAEHWEKDPDKDVWWWNKEKFACTQHPSNTYYLQNEPILGRSCDVDSCGSRISHLGWCDSNAKALSGSAPIPPPAGTMPGTGGLHYDGLMSNNNGNMLHQGSQYLTYRGLNYRQISVNIPYIIDFEGANVAPCQNGGGNCPSWVQWLSGASGGQQISCPLINGKTDCMGTVGNAGKLVGLVKDQTVEAVLTASFKNSPTPDADPNEAMSIAIRYSNGSNINKPLRVDVSGTAPMNPEYVQVHGAGSAYTKQLFGPTGNAETYQTVYFYPIYPQDTSGLNGSTASGKLDTLRVRFSGETGGKTDAPHLDAAYFYPGAPPADRPWSYIAPKLKLVAIKDRPLVHWTPPLPHGNYTLSIEAIEGGDLNVYVKVGGKAASEKTYDCVTSSRDQRMATYEVSVPEEGAAISAYITTSYERESVGMLQVTNVQTQKPLTKG